MGPDSHQPETFCIKVRTASSTAARKRRRRRFRSELGLDAGYLSRMLLRFEKERLLTRRPSNIDGRQSFVSLTARGHKAFMPLDARAGAEVGAILKKLSASKQGRLVEAMSAVQEILSDRERESTCVLRAHQPDDMGWVERLRDREFP